MSRVLKEALEDEITHQVTHQVTELLGKISGEMTSMELMKALGLKDRVNFRLKYLEPALKPGFIEMSLPDTPRSPTQRYRLTFKGRNHILMGKKKH